MRVNRLDTTPLGKAERTPTGGLRLPAVLTRPGVFEYRDSAGKTIREYRPPSEVHDPASMASLGDAAVTIGHPRAGVSPETWGRDSVGYVRADTLGKDESTQGVSAAVVVARGDAVEGVSRSDSQALRDLSGGYSVELDETPGVTPEGEQYDRVQRKIRYNHVALLRRGDGRQGTSVGLRLDSAGHALDEETPMKKIKVRVDSVIHEVEAGSDEHLSLQAKADAETAKALTDAATLLVTEKKRADDATAALTVAKARLDAIDAAAAKSAREALEGTARKVLGEATKFDGQTDRQIMAAVVTKSDAKFVDDGTPERAPYVQARFDVATTALNADKTPTSAEALAAALKAKPRTDAATDPTPETDPIAFIAQCRADSKKLADRKGDLHL